MAPGQLSKLDGEKVVPYAILSKTSYQGQSLGLVLACL